MKNACNFGLQSEFLMVPKDDRVDGCVLLLANVTIRLDSKFLIAAMDRKRFLHFLIFKEPSTGKYENDLATISRGIDPNLA